jgi:aminodeoxyfutalosine synthase
MKIEIDAAVAERARKGATLTDAELLALDAADVLSLGMLGDEVRRARVGDAVSYTRVLEAGATGLPADDDTAAALRAAHEVRLTTLAPTLRETVAAIAGMRARIGETQRLTGFSLADLTARGWGSLAGVLAALKAAGLGAVAEAPVDSVSASDVAAVVAADLGPGRLSVQRWPVDGRVPLLLRTRAIIEATPFPHRFAPLSREQSVAVPTTGYHDVRLVALARVALPGVDVIEVDWQQYGPKLAQVALMFGANHLDRVSPIDDPALGPRRARLEEVRRNIAAAGFRPVGPGEAA